MRLLIQRVSHAKVEVGGEVISKIDQGLLVFVGVEPQDNTEDNEWLSKKLLGMRIFPDDEGKMNLSLPEVDGEMLVVSQFTLHAQTKKGNRPSFVKAAAPEKAKLQFDEFVRILEIAYPKKIQTGKFGAMMEIRLCNSGPVTIFMDSQNRNL